MNPDCWGPNAWYIFHYLGLVNDRDGYSPTIVKFYQIFIFLLMCQDCRLHGKRFKALLADLDTTPEKSARENTLFEYSWILHNMVNARLKKVRMGLEEAREHWKVITIDEQDEDEDEMDIINRRMLALWEFLTRVFTHYDQNQEPQRKENYTVLLMILPGLIEAFAEEKVSIDGIKRIAAAAIPLTSKSLLRFLEKLMDLLEEKTSLATVCVKDGISRCKVDYRRSRNEAGASFCEKLEE
jgi:hypothetical protein